MFKSNESEVMTAAARKASLDSSIQKICKQLPDGGLAIILGAVFVVLFIYFYFLKFI